MRVLTLCVIEIILQVVFRIWFCIPALHWAGNDICAQVDSIQSGTNWQYINTLTRTLHIKAVYQTQRTLHHCQDGDKDKVMPLNINITPVNTTCLREVTLLNIKSIRINIKGICPYPKIGEPNHKKAYYLYLNIVE